jgi:hypothetical protein
LVKKVNRLFGLKFYPVKVAAAGYQALYDPENARPRS